MLKEKREQIKNKVSGWLKWPKILWVRFWGWCRKVTKRLIRVGVLATVVFYLIWEHEDNPERAEFIGYLFGGVLLYRQILDFSRRATAAEETVALTEKGHGHERFKIAIDHLGNTSASVRLGGIYSLHQIAQDVEEYRERVFEILCSHIRESTSSVELTQSGTPEKPYKPTIETQSILNLLFVNGRGGEIYDNLHANLDNVCLKMADLANSNLQNAKLFQAKLNRTKLEEANLRNAFLTLADLSNASLASADLRDAKLFDANLQGADFLYANLEGASLNDANLQNAILSHANLNFSNVRGADFHYADLQHADLRNVGNLKIKQLIETDSLYKAKLPDGVEEEICRYRPELLENPDDRQKD